MAETTWAVLRGLLVERYDHLKRGLTRKLGSEELASESLHETWLRLHREDSIGTIHNASGFLFRVALNLAIDRLRGEKRRIDQFEIEALLDVPDSAPGPARTAHGRLELEMLEQAIQELPKRTRAILLASRIEGLTHQAIARRLRVSKRTVAYELKRAMKLLEARLEEKSPPDCAPPPPESSQEEGDPRTVRKIASRGPRRTGYGKA